MTTAIADFDQIKKAAYDASIERLDRLLTASGNFANVERLRPVDLREAVRSVLPTTDEIDVRWVAAILTSNPQILENGSDRAEDLRESIFSAVESTVWDSIEPDLKTELDRRIEEYATPESPGL